MMTIFILGWTVPLSLISFKYYDYFLCSQMYRSPLEIWRWEKNDFGVNAEFLVWRKYNLFQCSLKQNFCIISQNIVFPHNSIGKSLNIFPAVFHSLWKVLQAEAKLLRENAKMLWVETTFLLYIFFFLGGCNTFVILFPFYYILKCTKPLNGQIKKKKTFSREQSKKLRSFQEFTILSQSIALPHET